MSAFFFQMLLPVLLGVLVVVMLGLAIYSTVRARRRDRQAIEWRREEQRRQRLNPGLPEEQRPGRKNDTGLWQLTVEGEPARQPDAAALSRAVEAVGVSAGYLVLTPPEPLGGCRSMHCTTDPDGGLAVQVVMEQPGGPAITRELGGVSRPRAAEILAGFWAGHLPDGLDSWRSF